MMTNFVILVDIFFKLSVRFFSLISDIIDMMHFFKILEFWHATC